MATKEHRPKQTHSSVKAHSFKLKLSSELSSTVHIVRYKRRAFKLEVQLFPQETNLVEWCSKKGFSEAISGGFFLRSSGLPLGEVWHKGQLLPHEPYAAGWAGKRGALYISREGDLYLSPRHKLPERIDGWLLEIGPTLVHQGVSMFIENPDPEGFTETAHQHDEDINCKRHPRAAIGMNDEFIWTVVVDGRTKQDSGMYLDELANIFIGLGATEAINLDGGRSSTQISNGKLRNNPRTDFDAKPNGYPIRNAVIFKARTLL